jgi:hypothetical protein
VNRTPSTLYIYISKQKKAYNYIKAMKVNGNIVTEPARVREEVLKYYANVYETRGNKAEIEEDFFNAISTLEKDAQDMCDTPLSLSLSLSELTEAVNRTSKRKSPGMDRLTHEFYE